MSKPLFSHATVFGDPKTLNVRNVKASQAVDLGDFWIVDTTAGNVTLTLPASRLSRGRQLLVAKPVAANQITIQAATGDTIGYAGGGTLVLNAADSGCYLIADGGTVWGKAEVH